MSVKPIERTLDDVEFSKGAGEALVVVAIDGLASLRSGIGSIVHWFFEAIDEISAATPALHRKLWSLHALSPRLDPHSSDFSPDVQIEVAEACARHHGDFRWFEVEDGSTLKDVWSLDKVERWRSMCQNAAVEILRLADHRRQVTVLAHGTMFATLRSHLVGRNDVRVVYMTHTLGRVFLDANSAARTDYEDEGFALLTNAPQDRIGVVSTYYRDVLLQSYGRVDSELAPFRNSVYKKSKRFDGLLNLASRPQVAPDGKRLVFSWGRCVPQKGFDVVIPAFNEFLSRRADANDWHLLLLAPREVAALDYVAFLRSQLAMLPPGSFTFVENFDPLLPFQILASAALKICVFASRFEAGPLTLIEALAFGHEHLGIVWNDIHPIRHLLVEQPDTFPFSPLAQHDIADAMLLAAQGGGRIAKTKVLDFAASMSAGLNGVLSI